MTDRKCAWCGADISWRGPKALTCSKRCKGKRDNQINPKYTRKPLVSCRCKVCEKTFPHHNPRARLCSVQCKAKERQLASKRQKEKKKQERKSSPIHKVCDWCGSPFTLERSRGIVYRQTCSEVCAQEKKNARWREMLESMPAHKREQRKDNHRQWERRRQAERALSLLLLPMQTPPET